MSDVWTWLNQLASTPAGATGLISAAVAFTGSLMTFFRVFLERRSNKLVARETERRAYRQHRLQPVLDDVSTLMRDYEELTTVVLGLKVTPPSEVVPVIQSLVQSLRRRDRPIHNSPQLEFGFPFVMKAALEIYSEMAPLLRFLEEEDIKRAQTRAIGRRYVVVDLVERFHRSVELDLFGAGLLRAVQRRVLAQGRLGRAAKNAEMNVLLYAVAEEVDTKREHGKR